LLNTYQRDEDSVLLKILSQASDHLHPVHKIPNYLKHPEEKVKSVIRYQNTEKLRKYPYAKATKQKELKIRKLYVITGY
jgi:hypothetical protein